jgi:electron transfer flavoprotein alpha subunit
VRAEDDGSVRATRPRFGGVVAVKTRTAPGVTVATVLPRGRSTIAATPLDVSTIGKPATGEVPEIPLALARRIVSIDPNVTPECRRAAQACAEALSARMVLGPTATPGKPLSPDLYVAIGVEGSTEHNAAFRNSRVVVAVVDRADAPIAQIADYLLVGDVEEHVKALFAALS